MLSVEDPPGVWRDESTERHYYGDVLRDTRKWERGEGLNDNLNISNRISIMADQFSYSHFQAMRYVEWMGQRWKILDVELQRPRLILTIGGLYNEETDRAPFTPCFDPTVP